MAISNDALTVLLARRRDLYAQLRLLDDHVAAAQKSAFFSTRPGNAATMGDSIEGVERQIAEINRQLGPAEGEPPSDEAMANPG